MPDDVKLPGGMHVNKKIAIGVGIAAVGIAGVYYYRQKQASNAAASTSAAAATGSQIDPQTGYAYGSPEDQAALAAMAGGTLPTYNAASSAGGQVIGYDQYGNPIYGGGGGTIGTGPGSYTSNAQWTQAAEAEMGSNGADAIAAALGKYLLGQPLTTDQITVVQEAIAAQGYPPVSGSGGFPPSYNTAAVPPPVQSGSGTQVTVPNVVGQWQADARKTLASLGFKVTNTATLPGHSYKVTAQTPKAGTNAASGSTVRLTLKKE